MPIRNTLLLPKDWRSSEEADKALADELVEEMNQGAEDEYERMLDRALERSLYSNRYLRPPIRCSDEELDR
jgi:hypothetical protein